MATNTKMLLTCDGYLFKRMAEAGLAWIEHNQEKVNQLNVFPVPDGDTGTNMFLTMRKAVDEIASLNEGHVGTVCQALAYGARLGARGNSGVILSEWWRGFAEALKDRETFDAALFAQACKNAVERAYKGTLKPVEGTILTVTRQAMEAVTERARVEKDLYTLFELKVSAAYESLRHTPDLLPVLKDAGVVDSGGQGWTFIMEGMLRLLRGEEIEPRTDSPVAVGQAGWQEALLPEDEQGYGYDVQFLMRGQGMDVDAVRAAISEIGWSTLVVGDDELIKVHVHVHDPGVPISYAIQSGAALDDVVVENMQRQYEAYVAQRQKREIQTQAPVDGAAVIAVAYGDGMRTLLAELGTAFLIEGGQTMNPSTEEILKAIENLPTDRVIILPNNKNIILAAQQTASVSVKKVSVIPCTSVPQGLSAMLRLDPDGNEERVVKEMVEAIHDVETGEVTVATRTVELNGVSVQKGQTIALLNGKLIASAPNIDEAILELLEKAGTVDRERITLFYGANISKSEVNRIVDLVRSTYPSHEIELHDGGQLHYQFIISIE